MKTKHLSLTHSKIESNKQVLDSIQQYENDEKTLFLSLFDLLLTQKYLYFINKNIANDT